MRRAPAAVRGLRQPPQIVREPGTTTVHAQIEDWLAGQIAAGTLVPGDRLPTEQDLAKWFGVSRMTLRHALAELAGRGLVTRTVGRHGGTFVAAPKVEQDLTTLAGFSEQLRRHGMVAGARVLSARERPAGPAAGAALRIGEDDLVYEVRRVRLGDGRPIALERSLFPAARFPGMLDFRLDGSLYELLEVRYGLRPHRARESLEPVTAGVREAEVLEVAEGVPLMRVERTAYARSGEPLEYARDLFRGDRTRVVVWTSDLSRELSTGCRSRWRAAAGRLTLENVTDSSTWRSQLQAQHGVVSRQQALDGWICVAVGRHRTTPGLLARALAGRPRMRWRRWVTAALADAAGGVHSPLERNYVHGVERAHGLPAAQRQARHRDGSGTRYLDNLYEPYGLCVELDGAAAHPAEGRWRDTHRDNANQVQGARTLRYGWPDTTEHRCRTAAEVAAVLHRHGWTGTLRPCSPTCTAARPTTHDRGP